MTLYEKNKNEFKQPEIRKVSYAVISLDSIQNKNITVDEQELKNIYKQKSFLFITPEKRVVKQVRFDSLSQAKKAEAELRRGDDFELVAKKYSPQFEKINLGVITVKDFEGDLSDKLFKLKSEEISDITETPLGLYIFKIDKIIPSKTKKYSEVKDLIQKEYLKEAQFNEFLQLVKKIQKELESGVNIELIAKKYNLKIKHTKVTSSANNENNISSFVTMAFKTALNAQSNLFPIDGENFCTLRVDDIIPEKIMDFSNVKNKIQKIWRNEEIIKKAKSLSFTAGKNYNSLRNAKLINFQNVKTEKISIAMSDSKQELPFDFTKKLFDLPDKGVTEPYIDYLNNEVLFGIIVKTKLPDKTTIYRYKQLYESQIYQIEQEAMLAELLGNLRGKHEIYIDPDLFF
jgi:peptidyl-prolyl cis-trans isomerase D